MHRFARTLFLVLLLSLPSLLACAGSTKSSDVYRLHAHGDRVQERSPFRSPNIIGHFSQKQTLEKLELSSIDQASESSAHPVCYLAGPALLGLRIEPCRDALLVNEGPLLDARDSLGVYFELTPPWGLYQVYVVQGKTWQKILERPLHQTHWKAQAPLVQRLDDSIQVQTSLDEENWRIESFSPQALLAGEGLKAPQKNTAPEQPTSSPVAP